MDRPALRVVDNCGKVISPIGSIIADLMSPRRIARVSRRWPDNTPFSSRCQGHPTAKLLAAFGGRPRRMKNVLQTKKASRQGEARFDQLDQGGGGRIRTCEAISGDRFTVCWY